jgi:hypothetical protein
MNHDWFETEISGWMLISFLKADIMTDNESSIGWKCTRHG